MEIQWNSDREYRAFFDPGLKSVCLVSSNLTDQAKGTSIDGVLMIVIDAQQQFCDFEMTLEPSRRDGAATFPHATVPAKGIVVTNLDETHGIRWFFDHSGRVLQVRFELIEAEYWVAVDSGRVLLGLGRDRSLRGLCCTDVIEDPDGEFEGRWLEQLEARR